MLWVVESVLSTTERMEDLGNYDTGDKTILLSDC